MDILVKAEEENLFLIQNAQNTGEAVDEMKLHSHQTRLVSFNWYVGLLFSSSLFFWKKKVTLKNTKSYQKTEERLAWFFIQKE